MFLRCFWSNLPNLPPQQHPCKETTTVKMYTFHQNREFFNAIWRKKKDTQKPRQLSWIKDCVTVAVALDVIVLWTHSTCRGWGYHLGSILSRKKTAFVRRHLTGFFCFRPPRQSGMLKQKGMIRRPRLHLIIVNVYFYIFHTYN